MASDLVAQLPGLSGSWTWKPTSACDASRSVSHGRELPIGYCVYVCVTAHISSVISHRSESFWDSARVNVHVFGFLRGTQTSYMTPVLTRTPHSCLFSSQFRYIFFSFVAIMMLCTHAEMLNFPTSDFHWSPFVLSIGAGGLLYVQSKINAGLEKEKACLVGRICACFDEKGLL